MSQKMRPYDEPPKRRRSLIPDAPGSAATGFLVLAALWLAAATGIGLLAIGLRIVAGVELSIPLGVFGLSFEVDARRVEHAFVTASVYGWLTNAGLAAILFATPRIVGRPLAMERLALAAVLFWNAAVAGGVTVLYIADLGAHHPLTSFPFWIDGGLAFGLFLVLVPFVVTVAPVVRNAYVSIWYFAVALLALLGLVTASAAISFVELPEVSVAVASAYLSRAIELFWVLGVAVGTLYYVVPRITGNRLYSAGLAMLGWLVWLALSGVAALAVAVDASIPYVVTTVGIAAALMLVAHAFVVVANLLLTMVGRWSTLLGTGTMAFAVVALAFLLTTPLLEAIGALRNVAGLVAGTEWQAGAFMYAIFGTATFAMFAFGHHALPRLLRREWHGGVLAGTQLWAGFGGATVAGLALIGAGLAEGSLRAQAVDAGAIANDLLLFRIAAAGGLGLLGLAALALVVSAFLAYTSARPADYAVPGVASTAGAGH